jgi:pyochelin biosynthesis protein PchC
MILRTTAAPTSPAQRPGNSDLWIRRFHPVEDPAVRLICFPHAGGSASSYFTLSRSLTPAVEVLAVQYPGRQERRGEPGIGDLGMLADQVTDAIEPWTGHPFALFGHSMGSVVAFEVARRLEARPGGRPRHLFVSGRRAPSLQRRRNVHLRDDAGVVEELLSLGGTDHRFLQDDELLATILPATRSDYQAIETYVYPGGPRVVCPVTAMVGDADPESGLDDTRAWSDHCGGGFELRVFPGGHFYLDACRTAVADTITAALQQQIGDHSVGGDTR